VNYSKRLGVKIESHSFGMILIVPVITAWDIGVGDATAIGWFQRIGREHHLVDYYESNGKGLDHYARVLQQRSLERKYLYEHVEGKIACIGPHDMKAREFGTGRTRQEQARDYGLYFRLVKRQSLEDGIAAVRRIFPALWLHEKHAERVIDAAGHYHKEWDEVKQCFGDKPVHDWSSHPMDMLRYYALSTRDEPAYTGSIKAVADFDPYSEGVTEAEHEFNPYEVGA
jgi:phage terminase large subunit